MVSPTKGPARSAKVSPTKGPAHRAKVSPTKGPSCTMWVRRFTKYVTKYDVIPHSTE
jgi:hypothetical protein